MNIKPLIRLLISRFNILRRHTFLSTSAFQSPTLSGSINQDALHCPSSQRSKMISIQLSSRLFESVRALRELKRSDHPIHRATLTLNAVQLAV
jgi:hypothetical protein